MVKSIADPYTLEEHIEKTGGVSMVSFQLTSGEIQVLLVFSKSC